MPLEIEKALDIEPASPKKTEERRQFFKGKIVSLLVPGDLLLGTALGNWYEKNPYHKFNEGDILILKKNNILGYGIRPVFIVRKFNIINGVGKYDITSICDDSGDFMDWSRHNKIQEGVGRETREKLHSKWNIENQFIRVDAGTAEEALAFYNKR